MWSLLNLLVILYIHQSNHLPYRLTLGFKHNIRYLFRRLTFFNAIAWSSLITNQKKKFTEIYIFVNILLEFSYVILWIRINDQNIDFIWMYTRLNATYNCPCLKTGLEIWFSKKIRINFYFFSIKFFLKQ